MIRSAFRRKPRAFPHVCYEITRSFEEAASRAGAGYSNPDLFVDCSPSHTGSEMSLPNYCAPIMAAVGIVSAGRGRISVIDVGGWNGDIGRFCFEAFPHLPMDWTVIETEAAVRHFSGVDERIRFLPSIDNCEPPDIVIFSGSLQYIAEWRRILESNPVRQSRSIVVARTPLADSEYPFLQTVDYGNHRIQYPGRIIAQNELDTILSRSHKKAISWSDWHRINEKEYPAPATLWSIR